MRCPSLVRGFAAFACAGLLLPFPVVRDAAADPVAVTNGVQFTDSAGDVLHGHGGGMIRVGRYYYWFGENPYPGSNQFRYISVYRSTDLRTWEFRNHVLTQESAAELKVATLWRPKVVYNTRTKQYVLFMRKERKPGDFSQSRVAVATSRTVDGDYTYRRSFRPFGYRSFDMTVFRDDDGRAYLISTTNDQKDLTIFRLAADYLGVAARVTTLHGVRREAQAVFKRNGVYFLLASGVTGWQPNQAKYATAADLAGPWSRMADVGDSIAYGSQSAYVLPVRGRTTTSYLYLGDRHANAWGGRVTNSEYVWLPLRFPTRRSLAMSWYPRISIDTETGAIRGIGSGNAYENLRARHSGKCLSVRWSSRENGAGLTQRTCATTAQNQHWQVLYLGNGYHRLIARHSHKCLTVPSSSTADGTRLTQRVCGTGANQQWRITKLASSFYRITARHSGKCLTIVYDPAAQRPKAVQHACKGSANQEWRRAGAL